MIQKGGARRGHSDQEDADLAVLRFAEAATILALHPDTLVASLEALGAKVIE